MKNTILTFIIGVLIGAIVTTLGLFVYIRNINSLNKFNPQGGQMMDRENMGNMENRPERPQGMQDGTNPPELPTT